MNKGRRNELRRLKRKKRLRNFILSLDILITDKGEKIYSPNIDHVPKNHMTWANTTGKPCSCAICSPRKAANGKYKNEVAGRPLIQQGINDAKCECGKYWSFECACD